MCIVQQSVSIVSDYYLFVVFQSTRKGEVLTELPQLPSAVRHEYRGVLHLAHHDGGSSGRSARNSHARRKSRQRGQGEGHAVRIQGKSVLFWCVLYSCPQNKS